ncbi:MAG: hypothetical protein ACREEM_08730 [Blastocatellia bacterium]
MKPLVEQKIRTFIDEADRQVAPAMSTVLKLLLNAYRSGTQNDFAKHCCKFPPGGLDMTMKMNNEAEDGWPDVGPNTFVN